MSNVNTVDILESINGNNTHDIKCTVLSEENSMRFLSIACYFV